MLVPQSFMVGHVLLVHVGSWKLEPENVGE